MTRESDRHRRRARGLSAENFSLIFSSFFRFRHPATSLRYLSRRRCFCCGEDPVREEERERDGKRWVAGMIDGKRMAKEGGGGGRRRIYPMGGEKDDGS